MSGTSTNGVVLITIDSLRADAVQGAGADERAPTLARLSDRAATFENAFAHGNWTPFSFPSIMASRPVFADSTRVGVPNTTTVAEALHRDGVETAGYNAANGFLTAHWGYDRGFDSYETYLQAEHGRIGRFLAAHPTVQGWLNLLRAQPAQWRSRLSGDSDRLVLDTSRLGAVEDRAIDFIENATDRFFLWVHYMDTHTPYVPDRRHREAVTDGTTGTGRMLKAHVKTALGSEIGHTGLTNLRTLYDAAVHQVDASIGRLLEALERAGRREETCLVVAGDHGEEFMEHGHLAHYPKLYDELVHVPLLIDHPDAPPRRVQRQVGLDALAPTICATMDVPRPPAFEGNSLLPVVCDGQRPKQEPITSVAVRGDSVTQQPIPRSLEDGDLLVSARTSDWTLIYNAATGERELYDRTEDGPECDDRWPLPDSKPAVEQLDVAVTDHADRLLGDNEDRSDESESPGTPREIEQQLDALGYR